MVDKIFVIESIPSAEKQTGKELFNDTIERYIEYHGKNITHKYMSVDSRDEFFIVMNQILSETTDQGEIVIHIEAHGGLDEIHFSNQDTLGWSQLENLLRAINLKSKNNLHLNLAACYGMHVAKKLDRKSTAPFKSYSATLGTVLPIEISTYNTLFYRYLIELQDLYLAHQEAEALCTGCKFKVKDLKHTLKLYFIGLLASCDGNLSLIKEIFDNYLSIDIDCHILVSKSLDAQIDYILELYFWKYLPK